LVTARLAPVMQGDDCANRAATDVNAAGCVQTSRRRLTVIHKWPQKRHWWVPSSLSLTPLHGGVSRSEARRYRRGWAS
jgi:hypothetical protein